MTTLARVINQSKIAMCPARRTISAQEFIALYDELFPHVYAYVRYRCNDATTADDLTATTFERALKSLGDYQPSVAPFSAWLFSIARNEVNKFFRERSTLKCLTIEDACDHPAFDPTPEEAFIEDENYRELFSAIATLDERERDLLGLKFVSRLTNRQIANITGLSESNVGVIVFRAVHKLRKELQAWNIESWTNA